MITATKTVKRTVVEPGSEAAKKMDKAFGAMDRAFGKMDEAFNEASEGFRRASEAMEAAEEAQVEECVLKAAEGRPGASGGKKEVPLTWRNRVRLLKLAFSRARAVRI